MVKPDCQVGAARYCIEGIEFYRYLARSELHRRTEWLAVGPGATFGDFARGQRDTGLWITVA